MKIFCFLIIVISYSYSFGSTDLESRIENLESQYLELLSRPTVSPLYAKSINIGGYFNVTATEIVPHGGTRQGLVDEVELGVILTGNVNDSLSFFTHIEFEQEKKVINKNLPTRDFTDVEIQVEPEDMWIDYRYSNGFGIQLGSLITPFGISNMEHFDYLRWQNEKPLALRESSHDFVFFDDHVNGLTVYGQFFYNQHTFNYYLYGGTNNVDHNEMMDGIKVQHRLDFSEGYIQTGLNLQQGSKFSNGQRYSTTGVDLRIKFKNFEMRAEYFDSIMFYKTNDIYGHKNSDYHSYSYYIEPWYHLIYNKHILYIRHDFIHDQLGIHKADLDGDGTEDYYQVNLYENTIGYNFLPEPGWRISIGFTWFDYVGASNSFDGKNADYEALEIGTVLSF